jgi:glycosyltransferase involved in cell wall biosynthesis
METTAPGGINKVIQEIASHMTTAGLEVIVCQPNPLGLIERETFQGFQIIRVKSSIEHSLYGFSPEMNKYLQANLDQLNPDIVHVHGYHTLLSFSVINVIKKNPPATPIIFSPHLDTYRSTIAGKYFWKTYNRVFGAQIWSKTDAIVSCSQYEADQIKIIANLKDTQDIHIISHGVDRIEPGQSINKIKGIRLLYSGYLIRRKNVDLVIEVLSMLVNIYHCLDITLTIVGNGPEKKNLLKLSRQLQIEQYIIWEPFLPKSEHIRVIKEATFLLLLSKSEAYGIIVAEALALGTPCIVAKDTALEEFVGEPGCFVVGSDAREIAELIIKMHGRNIVVGPLSDKIRTWDWITQDYINLYRSEIKKKFD